MRNTTSDELVVTEAELHDSIALAMQTGRLEGLMEAETAVLAEIDKTKWASDAKVLRRAARAIQNIRGVS